MSHDPLERLRMFPGSIGEQVVALTDVWKERSCRTFDAMRERMNELEGPTVEWDAAAFNNYFRRADRVKAPEVAVWALIRVMRDDAWLPKPQQCTLAEALYLAALKNVSVLIYARIRELFSDQEEEFRRLCPLGDFIAEKTGAPCDQREPHVGGDRDRARRLREDRGAFRRPLEFGLRWAKRVAGVLLLAAIPALVLWAVVASVGVAQR